MTYMLKKNQPEFDVVDGPFAGKKYRHNKTYAETEIPPDEKHKFGAVRKERKSEVKGRKSEVKKKGGSEVDKPAGVAGTKSGSATRNPKSGGRGKT